MRSAGYVVKGTPEKILKVLVELRNRGEGKKPLAAGDIATGLGIDKRAVFAAVNELRHDLCPIARASRGYFYAVNAEELEGTVARLEAEAFEMLKVTKALRSIYPPRKTGELEQLTLI